MFKINRLRLHNGHTDQSGTPAVSSLEGLVSVHWQGWPWRGTRLRRLGPLEANCSLLRQAVLVTASPARTLSEDHQAQSCFVSFKKHGIPCLNRAISALFVSKSARSFGGCAGDGGKNQ